MHIICLVKFIPDVDNWHYDYESHVLIRDKSEQIINPDDSAALAYALSLKQARGASVEVVTMGPQPVVGSVRDLLRCGADRAVILTDKQFAGSDTYATSLVLATYLQDREFDLILTGTRALDGDTAHVPAQIAEILGLEQMSFIKKFDEPNSSEAKVVFDVETDREVLTYEMALPAVCSLTRDAPYKLPYIRYDDIGLYVDDRLEILGSADINLPNAAFGQNGSLTKIASAFTKDPSEKEQIFVKTDDEGVLRVYEFLVEEGYL